MQENDGTNSSVLLKHTPSRLTLFYSDSGKRLEEVYQRDDTCSIPGNIQGQDRWCSEQPDPVEDAPSHCRGFRLDSL